jgi:mannan endo-1,4-beta-mannosidase
MKSQKPKYTKLKSVLIFLLLFCNFNSNAQVTRDASSEAKALLDLYYKITGKYTLTGQHNYPDTKNRNTRFVNEYTGETPIIWSSDFGFAQKGDKDSYLARPDIIKEAIRQHKKGSIITLCWHAVPPTADEPVTFQTKGKPNAEFLASVQGHMLNEQYKELLTPGTRLFNKWAAQVDTIAKYLKQLQDAKVPVLWRPYHEMNGDWFWWGGRVGENNTADIYRQLFDRLVNYHKLNNLIWVWNVDRPSLPIRKFSNFYPGNEYLDIVSLDVYGSDFNQAYYDSLMVLTKGKPILFGEVGNPPSLGIYKTQPNWSSWVIWAGMCRNTTKKQYHEFYNSERMLTLEDKTYWEVSALYRRTCGLPVLPLKPKFSINFSGSWKFNEQKSNTANSDITNLAETLKIDQDDELVFVKKYTPGEFGDDRITCEDFYLDGTPITTELYNSPKTTSASFDVATQNIQIKSVVKINRDGSSREIKSSEEWQILEGGKVLKITQTSDNYKGETKSVTLIYIKQ